MKFRLRFVAVLATVVVVIVTVKLHLLQRLNTAVFARKGVDGYDDDVGGLDDVAALIVDIWRRSTDVSTENELTADINALKSRFERASAKETLDKGNTTRRVRYLECVIIGTLEAIVAVGSASSTRGVEGEKGARCYSEKAAAEAQEAARQRRLFVAERLTSLLNDGDNRIHGETVGKRSPKYLRVFDDQPNGLVGLFVSGL